MNLTAALFLFSVDQNVMNLHQREQYLNTSTNWNLCECRHPGESVENGCTRPSFEQFDTFTLQAVYITERNGIFMPSISVLFLVT
jgi:hypothetical protein